MSMIDNNKFKEEQLEIENNKLKEQLNDLTKLQKQFFDWSQFDLKRYEVRLNYLLSKAKFMTHQHTVKKLDEIETILNNTSNQLDERISQSERTLIQFDNLDPALLAEYRRLKDDLECQDLLIEISKDNKSSLD